MTCSIKIYKQICYYILMNKWLLFIAFLLIQTIIWIFYLVDPIFSISESTRNVIVILIGIPLEIIFLISLIWIFSKDSYKISTIMGFVFTSFVAFIIWLPMKLILFGASLTDGAVIVSIIFFFLGVIANLFISGIVYIIRKKANSRSL